MGLKIYFLSCIGLILFPIACKCKVYYSERLPFNLRCSNYLSKELKHEINSYRDIVQHIMEQIQSAPLKDVLYDEYTKFIDKFGARPSGSKVLEESIDYMVNLTIKYGTDTEEVIEVKTEELEVPHWVRGEESVKMIRPRLKNIAVIGLGSSVPTPKEGIEAELIVVRSFHDLEQLPKNDVKGKIVLFDREYTDYEENVKYRIRGASKAARKGAVATLIKSITPFSLYTTHTGEQDYKKSVVNIPAGAITIEDSLLLRRLFDRGEKVILKIVMQSTYDTKISRNTIIDLKGVLYPEKKVIVSGHIDSVDVGEGAMDDGGGMFISWFVPVGLKLLRLVSKRTVRSILWTAEEPGLIGAAAYLKRHIQELDNITFIMESDEGTFNPRGLDVAGSNGARCMIAQILKLFRPIDTLTENDEPGSDITLFTRKGVPGASLLNDNERYFWYHHSRADTLSVQNKDDVVKCAAFWAAVSYVISDLSVDIPRD
ncbi:carboxypeptidase Q-like [Leptidea sinapis]|uniref:carboxypeptidase Q-like n=1 Tax=Leptidea sinapis TaxID=189913 RepID=UPI0021243BCD|nr:carboxypeptidase Q-like [Leptidea sinapis]XP_050678134.1 carboxypeptidase Q-like [Leptidea sinapis]